MTRLLRSSIVLTLLLTACSLNQPDVVVTNPSPSAAPSDPPQPTLTVAPTLTALPTATFIPTPETTPTAEVTPTPEVTNTPEATATSAATATTEATATVAPSPAPSAAATATAAATAATTATAGTTPDGVAVRPDLAGKIAFARNGGIALYTPATGEVRDLIPGGAFPQFSPDGSLIAYARDEGLYLAAADGSDERQIADLSGVRDIRWADDGSKIAFVVQPDENNTFATEIWTIELPEGEPRKIADGNSPAWAPDNRRIAYVTPFTSDFPRRTELHLTNWRGENDWPVVRNLPGDTPPIGVPGSQLPTDQLEHLMFDPQWNADGSALFVPAFVISQVETDFIIFERADPINGGSTFISELQFGATDMYGSPDRQAAAYTASSARGDVQLRGVAVGTEAAPIPWLESVDGQVFQAPAWSPASNALATYRCNLDSEGCDLVLFEPDAAEPSVLVPAVTGGPGFDPRFPNTLSWGR